ncbi:hypothetical protein ACJX0J_038621, partial [Zea mays]
IGYFSDKDLTDMGWIYYLNFFLEMILFSSQNFEHAITGCRLKAISKNIFTRAISEA